MNFFVMIMQLIGSLGFLLYGMKLMSDGIQKSTGEKLQKALGFMTGNSFVGMLTGMAVTMIIQSSGATTVMVVSFVNAGMMTLRQSIGVIFGANIGTTVTAWIVAAFGFNFDIESFAVPLFGIGFALTTLSRLHKENLGEALMGFSLLFVGLGMLSSTVSPTNPVFMYLSKIQDFGFGSLVLALAIGFLITALLHSSSAMTAIILTLAYNKMISWEFSAAMVLGSNVGSTIDSVMAAIGKSVPAKQASFIHVLFNSVAASVGLIFLKPLLRIVDFIVPGEVADNIIINISMLHTLLNTFGTVAFLPFTNQLADLATKLIRPSASEENKLHEYRLDFNETTKENVSALMFRAEREIEKFTDVASGMFERIQRGIEDRTDNFVVTHLASLEQEQKYSEQMHEQLTKFLVHAEHLPASSTQMTNISLMLQIVEEIEIMTHHCLELGSLLAKSVEKQMEFPKDDMERLIPYVDLAQDFLKFIRTNINKHLDKKKVARAHELEEQIDMFRKNLKKLARKRLESGANVKAELLYIDIVRRIEKIGDCAFAISEALAHTV